MKKITGFLSMALALLILFTAFPLTVFAGNNDDFEPPGWYEHSFDHVVPLIPIPDTDDDNPTSESESVRVCINTEHVIQVDPGEFMNLTGTVTYDDGSPVPDIIMCIRMEGSAGTFIRRTDDNGIFTYQNVYKNEYTIPFTVWPQDEQYICEPERVVVYVTGESRAVNIDEADHGTVTASKETAKNGDTVYLNVTPEEGYWLKEWEVVRGGVTIKNNSFIMGQEEVELRPVFAFAETRTVTINTGLSDPIVITGKDGTSFFDLLENNGAWDALCALDNDDYTFRDVTTKPLEEFSDEEEYTDDAFELINRIISDDMNVYAGFFRKLKKVELDIAPLIAGTEFAVSGSTQTPKLRISIPKSAHCSAAYTALFEKDDENGYFMPEGALEAGKTYYIELLLNPDFGFFLDDDTVVTARGAKCEESGGRMSIYAILSAEAAEYLLGDVNGDGEVNIIDATAIQRHIAGTAVLEGDSLRAADANGDGTVDIDDVTAIQKYVAKIIDALG